MNIATLSKTREILNKYDLHALKRFGQNFLVDPKLAERIAKEACDEDAICLEVGPGLGALTEFEAVYAKEVYAYEIDKKLVPVLEAELNYSNIHIINADFLELDLTTLPYQKEEITFSSNLPYYITTAILSKLIEANLRIRKITLMMQKEVGERISAKKGDKEYAALSLIIQDRYEIKELFKVSRNSYEPKPDVESVVLQLIPKTNYNADNKEFYIFLQKCFTQKRKTLHNNLKLFLMEDKINEIYLKCALKDNIRPQELDLVTYKKIFEVIND